VSDPAPRDLDTVRARMESWEQASTDPLPSPQEAHLDFGPRWRVLQSRGLGKGAGLAHLRLPAEAQGDLANGHLLHPALMDIATGWAMGLIDGYDGSDLWVPMSYGALRVHAPLGPEVWSLIRLTTPQAQETGIARFDITLTDPGVSSMRRSDFVAVTVVSGRRTVPTAASAAPNGTASAKAATHKPHDFRIVSLLTVPDQTRT